MGLDAKRMQEFEANILSVMDEVVYSQKNGNRIDVALFLNGLSYRDDGKPKICWTGTNFRHAERQYRAGSLTRWASLC